MTITDDQWSAYMSGIIPDNFMSNISDEFTKRANNILDKLMNRISKTVILGANNIYNPFDKYTNEINDYGDTIQNIFVGIDTGRELDEKPAKPDPFATSWPDATVTYATYNASYQFKKTLNYDQLKQAFTSPTTYGTFAGNVMASMYQGAGLNRFLAWKKYLSTTTYTTTAGRKVVTLADDNDAYAKEVLNTIKDYATNKLKYPSSLYNTKGVLNTAPSCDVYITTETKNMIDAYLSGVYNIDKLEVKGVNFYEIDSWATCASSAGAGDQLDVVIVDPAMCHYVPRSPQSGSLANPENLYVNYWYTEQGTYYVNHTNNAAQIFKKVSA